MLEVATGGGEEVLRRLGPRSAAAAQARSIATDAHRPWPLPDGPWLQGQTWCDLLFAHWSLSPDVLRPAIPAELPIDTFDGRAWIAVTPFEVRGLRMRGTAPLPRVSRFAETNVRTYTTVGGKPGIYFLSLDAGSRLAVAAARRTYRLPYFRADMAIDRTGDQIVYRSRRSSAPEASLGVRYRPTGAVFRPRPGTLEHFLTERYCLYTRDGRGQLRRAEIHHPPWPLQQACADFSANTMTITRGIEPAGEPLLHFSARQDVLIWPLAPVDEPGGAGGPR